MEKDMKIKILGLVSVVFLSLVVGWTSYAQKQKPTWDYYVTGFGSLVEAQGRLRELGDQGWELVAVTETGVTKERSGSITVYLRKSK
jgi:hypothetical protein